MADIARLMCVFFGGGGMWFLSECLFFSTFCERRLGPFSALDKLFPLLVACMC